MARNQALLKSIHKTVIVAFEYYDTHIKLDDSYENDPIYFFISLKKVESQLENLPEFKDSVKLMSEDKVISSLEHKLIGTLSFSTNIGSLSNILNNFLQLHYRKFRKYEEKEIDNEFQRFEDFFYTNYLIKLDSARLYNFNSSIKEIKLDSEVTIKLVEDEKSDDQNLPFGAMNYHSMTKSNFFIEREFKTQKIVSTGMAPEEYAEIEKKELPNSPEIFDYVISSLRLIRPSGVYRDHKVQSKVISYTLTGGTSTISPFFENTVIGEKFELQELEITELVKLFCFIRNEKDSRFGVANRRLTGGIERRNLEDKLIDYMVGLETLYLPDGTAELSFRLSLRVCFLLFADKNERKKAFIFLRELYNVRSQIVHGKPYKLTNEDVLIIEDYLRKSIKLWISDKRNFLAKISNTEDGKLNSLFFE